MIVPESAGNDHRPVVRVLLLVAEYVGDDVEPLDAPDGVLHEYPDAAFATILFFESLAQWSSFGLFPRHGHGVAGEFLKESLKPRIHPDPYLLWNVIREPRPLHDAEIVLLAFGGGAYVPHPPPPGGQDDVLTGMALLLARIESFLTLFRSLRRLLHHIRQNFNNFFFHNKKHKPSHSKSICFGCIYKSFLQR